MTTPRDLFKLPGELVLGGAKTRYTQNLEALRVLHSLRARRASPGDATTTEQEALSLYSGWGDTAVLKHARKVTPSSYSWGKESVTNDPSEEIAELVTDDEWQSLLGSTPNAHYTRVDLIRAIWEGVSRLGYGSQQDVRFLEPACGVGHFLGAAPTWLRERCPKPVLVELDQLTAEIASYLYPEADVVQTGFERTFRKVHGERTLENYFDVAVTNVPFGKIRVADPGMRPRSACESVHNYFITRMLELVRPGGLVVVVTSRYTLDGTTSAPVCRRAWADSARLELALRLPCDTFRANAGTDVVTDVLYLRRLLPGEEGNGGEWEESNPRPVWGTEKKGVYVDLEGNIGDYATPYSTYEQRDMPCSIDISVSNWYQSHPDCVLGKETLTGSMYANKASYGELSWEAKSADLKASSATGRTDYAENGRRRKWAKYNVESTGDTSLLEVFCSRVEQYLELSRFPRIHVGPSAERETSVLPEIQEYQPGTDLQRRWWETYKAAKEVIRIQVEGCSDEELKSSQDELRFRYGSAWAATGKTGGGVSHKVVVKAFVNRPDILSFLQALEKNDGSPEAIFSERTVYPEPPPSNTSDPADALYQCLDRLGRVDIRWIGKACQLSDEQVVEQLGPRVFYSPASDQWVLREEYLSGNVRRKLRVAQGRVDMGEESLERNVEELTAVLPPDVDSAEITLSLKSSWIPAELVSAFIRQLLDGTMCRPGEGQVVVRIAGGGWALEWNRDWDTSQEARKWDTDRADLGWLLQCGLDGKTPRIYDYVEELGGRRRRVMNPEESVLAQAKLDLVQGEYREWLWSDPERATTLTDVYNDAFNCLVPRRWDGSFLTFPGMSTSVDLRPFQKDGVARILFSDRENHPALIWPTGAGKTYGGIAAIEKLLQLGLASKILICVPKHLVGEWSDSYRRLFPGRADQILCADKGSFAKKHRGTFLARAATGGYRAVVISHHQLKSLPVTDETFQAVVKEQLSQLESEIEDEQAQDDSRNNVTLKRLQAMKKSLEARLRHRAESTKKDSTWTVTFEEMGFDVLLGDEAQVWKNLQLVTRMGNVAGIRTGSSQISLDFLVKIRHLQRKKGRLILTTATPIANSLAEAYVFATYLQNDSLKEQGIDSPDAFFGAFTRTYSSVELEPSCSGYRVVSRLEFGNIPELVHMLRQSWHVVKPADLGLTIPVMATGKEIVVQTSGSPDLRRYIDDIAHRVVQIREGRVQPDEDNMLKICSDGRWASLVNGPPDGEIRDTKLDEVVTRVVQHYEETQEERGAQLVFCDLGTPTGERAESRVGDLSLDEVLTGEGQVAQTRVYQYVRQQLVKAGIPSQEVAFLQDHQGDQKKLRKLYSRVNSGDCRVLIGSAPTGMNVQERLIALHHIDPVWRPDWKIQRDGRILRQGNRYGTVYVYLYLTEGSFDAYMWGLVRAKLRVIEQVTHGDPSVRRVDGDVGDMVMRASEIQAIASGNPQVLEFVAVQNELTRLSALRNEWERNQLRMSRRQKWIPGEVARKRRAIQRHQEALVAGQEQPKRFSIVLKGEVVEDTKEASRAVNDAFRRMLPSDRVVLGAWGKFQLIASLVGRRRYVGLSLGPKRPEYSVVFRAKDKGVWTTLRTKLCEGPRRWTQRLTREIDDAERDLRTIEKQLPLDWDRGPEYARTYAKYKALESALAGIDVSSGDFRAPREEWVDDEEAGRIFLPQVKVPFKIGRSRVSPAQLRLF